MGQPSSGQARAVWDLAAAQGGLGCRVDILTTSGWVDDPVADAAVPVRPHVRVFPVAGPASFAFSPAAERWARSPEAAAFPVLHQHGIWQAFSRVTLRWREQLRRPTVVAPHGSLGTAVLAYSPWKKALARLAYEGRNLAGASCLHATAAGELRELRELGFRNPVAVLPNGVSESWLSSVGDAARFRSAHGLPADERILLYISRIHRKKGLLTLVEAFARNRRPLDGWTLVVAGPGYDPPYLAAVEAMIAEEGLASRVRLVGELRGAGRRDAFAAAELMVLPSVNENFGLVVAEALGVGVPVITTRGVVAWELLEAERIGWWVHPDLASLEEALLSAGRLGPAELAAMGGRGRALILRDYRWGPIARRTLELYAWLAGDAARPDFVATG
ncbi:MAG TPA: glycosyltransferase [Longimicrobium sp.]|jgi:glycosyltransferase involved in cell wall biosynthesis